MKLDASAGDNVRAFLRALFALAEPSSPQPPPPAADATIVFIVHPPVRK